MYRYRIINTTKRYLGAIFKLNRHGLVGQLHQKTNQLHCDYWSLKQQQNRGLFTLSLSLAAVNHSVDPERLKIDVLYAPHRVTAQLHLPAKDAHRAVHLQRSAQSQGRELCVLVRLEIGADQAARPVIQSNDEGTGGIAVAVDSVNNNATDRNPS